MFAFMAAAAWYVGRGYLAFFSNKKTSRDTFRLRYKDI